jgi:hypothetical protein
MACAPSTTALRPEPQTLLMVSAEVWSGMPAARAACRAGAWPTPAVSTQPMMVSFTSSARSPARFTASRITCAPSCGAVRPASAPWNFPIAVRQALAMTTSVMGEGSRGSWGGL